MADLGDDDARNNPDTIEPEDYDDDDATIRGPDDAGRPDEPPVAEEEEEDDDDATIRGPNDDRHPDEPPPLPTAAEDFGGGVAGRYRELMMAQPQDGAAETASIESAGEGADWRGGTQSPVGSLSLSFSLPGDRSSSSSPAPAPPRPRHPSPAPSSLFRPFDRRFHSRLASSASLTTLNVTAAAAYGSGLSTPYRASASLVSEPLGEGAVPASPWEVVRWARLKRLTGQVFSEAGRRSFGTPTCLAVGAAIVLGTSKGVVLMFDHGQNLKAVIGPGTRAVDCGAVTSIAISLDQTTIGAGHRDGTIFTWETTRPTRPFLHIPHLEPAQLASRTADGHAPGAAVIHLGFLAARRTALVSADDRGMAFAHLATRGTGALGRTVKTARLLGRYPENDQDQAGAATAARAKPTTVLAFAPLPLGGMERAADTMGLTAMLTPYLLVVVSTTPVAQTQHKSARPRDAPPAGATTGCLAWFPAVQAGQRQGQDQGQGPGEVSRAKLAYCWSDTLTVLDVDEVPAEEPEPGTKPQPGDSSMPGPPRLRFRSRSRWRSDEAVVAVQWISRTVMAVLTVTQRLILLEDGSMRPTDGCDLLSRHIYHADLFSSQLRAGESEQQQQVAEGAAASESGRGPLAVADAFHMSFKTYRGRMFLLGFGDVSIGALTGWRDRVAALAGGGDHAAAVRLITAYYCGDAADLSTVGLPEDAETRRAAVRDRLIETVTAAVEHGLTGHNWDGDPSDDDEGGGGSSSGGGGGGGGGNSRGRRLRDLAEACFAACLATDQTAVLFDDVFERFEAGGAAATDVFLETLERQVLEGAIRSVPPAAVKAAVVRYAALGREARLEEMICRIDPTTLDLDQVTTLCRRHHLYDALVYVWTRGLADYVTALKELVALVPAAAAAATPRDHDGDDSGAARMFPYLACALTGRVYPTGEPLPEEDALRAKSELYPFLFAGEAHDNEQDGEGGAPFPHLGQILDYDAPSLLSSLNEAFEDPFLNEPHGGGGQQPGGGMTVDRQYIVSVLLEVVSPGRFGPEVMVYLDMFIARNLAKFPQYLVLPGSTLARVLQGLCDGAAGRDDEFPEMRRKNPDLAEDCQLSAEYLLSMYQPPDVGTLIPLLTRAGFYRVLRRIYRADGQYGRLIEAYLEDPAERGASRAVLDCIADCLRPGHGHGQGQEGDGLGDRQARQVLDAVRRHAADLLGRDAAGTARTLAAQSAPLHRAMLEAGADRPDLQYAYLEALLLLPADALSRPYQAEADLIERHIQLMCRFDPARVREHVGSLDAHLRLEELLPTMEDAGVVDAAVTLMAHQGRARDAMDRLVRHLGMLETATVGLLLSRGGGGGAGAEDGDGTQSEDGDDLQEGAEGSLLELQKYVHVGIWLCQGQDQGQGQAKGPGRERGPTITRSDRRKPTAAAAAEASLSPSGPEGLSADEALWLSLIDAALQTTRRVSTAIATAAASARDHSPLDEERLLAILRSLVQHTFTSLLTSTSEDAAAGSDSGGGGASFLRVLRAFLARAAAASPTLADLRAVLESIFAAYAYEESILHLSARLLEQSLAVSVGRAATLRQRGWRPRGSACEGCGRRVWGPGLVANVYEEWEEAGGAGRRRRGEGGVKGKEKGGGSGGEEGQHGQGQMQAQAHGLEPLVVLACRHIYHQRCIAALQQQRGGGDEGGDGVREWRCPLEGEGGRGAGVAATATAPRQ